MATTKKTSPLDPVEEPILAEQSPYDNVRIKLPRSKGDDKGIYVNVNDHNWYIPRGEIVVVPRYIAEVIENSITQDERTQALIEDLTGKAEEKLSRI